MVELKSGQTSTGTLSLVDQVTGLPVPGATFANTTASGDNDAVATVSVNPDGTILVTGITAGTVTATINAIVNFNNSLGNPDSQALTLVETVTVDAVPVANPVALAISWSVPA